MVCCAGRKEEAQMNLALLLAIVGCASAQVLKVLISLVWDKEVDLRKLMSSGGMPSSHSATVCAFAAAAGMRNGFDSPIFGLAAVVAFIVMYDAANVRNETGKQAKILNYMMENWNEMKPELFGRELKELIGHTPLQVAVGAVLGVFIGWFGCMIAGG